VTAETRPMLFARAAAALRPPRDLDGELDLPVLTDPVVGLQRSVTVLAIVSMVIVAATAPQRVSGGYGLSDVGALLVLYAIGTFAVSKLPWERLPSSAAAAIVGTQLLFVVSLTTVTGGGNSAYFVLYAPVLALAGWHLRRDWVVLAVASVAIVEWWRAMVVEHGAGNADQLVVALPLFAAIAALAHVTAEQLHGAIATIRRDQLRTAETLAAVRALGSAPGADPVAAASAAAARIFASRARLVTFDPPTGERAELLARSAEGRRLSVGIIGAAGTHAVLELERAEPFSVTEARLAALLGGTAGQAADGRQSGHGVHI
jgi:hypothetical protein